MILIIERIKKIENDFPLIMICDYIAIYHSLN